MTIFNNFCLDNRNLSGIRAIEACANLQVTIGQRCTDK